MKKVAIIMGSKNDYGVVKDSVDIIKSFGVATEVRIMSAHRSPDAVKEFAVSAREDDIAVIIAAAGKAAHLAGVVAGYTTLPVIGLPIKSSTLDGLDSLLSIVQMPAGIPVATVAINGGTNAGLLALQILSLNDNKIAIQLEQYKKDMATKVMEDDKNLDRE